MCYAHKLLLFAFLSLLLGCRQDDKNFIYKIEDILEVQIKGDYTVLENSSSFGIGDYTETFLIQFKKEDFNIFLEQLRNVKMDSSDDKKFLSFSTSNSKGDYIFILIGLENRTIQYSLADF